MSNTTSADVVLDEVDDNYSVPLQIGGLFMVIATSFLGIALAVFLDWLRARYNGKASLTEMILQQTLSGLRGVGAGVIISTALIHLIGEAYEPFEDSGFSELYEQWPMVFAMLGLFVMALLEFFHKRLHSQSQCYAEHQPELSSKEVSIPIANTSVDDAHKQNVTPQPETLSLEKEQKEGGWTKEQLNAILVEGSILIHSVLIGFDLGLQSVDNWIPLVCAICFHQFFEGFAIGAVILEAKFTLLKKSLMIFFYSVTTAIGIAIGIGTYVSQDYDGQSVGANITIGVLDSICGGFLLYLGMSIFLVEWFVNNTEFHTQSSLVTPMIGFFGVFLGMAIMAIIGMWA